MELCTLHTQTWLHVCSWDDGLSCMLFDCHAHIRLLVCFLHASVPVSWESDLGNLRSGRSDSYVYLWQCRSAICSLLKTGPKIIKINVYDKLYQSYIRGVEKDWREREKGPCSQTLYQDYSISFIWGLDYQIDKLRWAWVWLGMGVRHIAVSINKLK